MCAPSVLAQLLGSPGAIVHPLNHTVLPVLPNASIVVCLCLMQVPEVTAAHEVIEVLDDDEVEETDVEEERVEELDEEERNVEEEAADELEEEPDEEEEEEEIVLLSDSEDDVGEEAAPREQPVEPRQQVSHLTP